MLSTIAESIPATIFALVAPKPSYNKCDTSAKYPIVPNPPTQKITPKKNNKVSHSALATLLNILNSVEISGLLVC